MLAKAILKTSYRSEIFNFADTTAKRFAYLWETQKMHALLAVIAYCRRAFGYHPLVGCVEEELGGTWFRLKKIFAEGVYCPQA